MFESSSWNGINNNGFTSYYSKGGSGDVNVANVGNGSSSQPQSQSQSLGNGNFWSTCDNMNSLSHLDFSMNNVTENGNTHDVMYRTESSIQPPPPFVNYTRMVPFDSRTFSTQVPTIQLFPTATGGLAPSSDNPFINKDAFCSNDLPTFASSAFNSTESSCLLNSSLSNNINLSNTNMIPRTDSPPTLSSSNPLRSSKSTTEKLKIGSTSNIWREKQSNVLRTGPAITKSTKQMTSPDQYSTTNNIGSKVPKSQLEAVAQKLQEVSGLEKIRWTSLLDSSRKQEATDAEANQRIAEAEAIGSRLFGGDLEKLLASLLSQHLDFLVYFVRMRLSGRTLEQKKIRDTLYKSLCVVKEREESEGSSD